MRVLVHGRSLIDGNGRMRAAAGGLAQRGHEVLWRGDAPPAGALPIGRLRDRRTDLVLGGEPAATALAGWRAGADGMVLALEPGAVARWTPFHRWCWESLHSYGVVEAPSGEPGDAAPGLERERLVAWSEAEPPAAPDATHPDTEILERTAERLLVWRSGSIARPAVFLDRDGTLVVERGYLADPDGIELLPEVPHALRTLRDAGFALVVVSNQSGVGRGYFSSATAHAIMASLRRALRHRGVELDAIYFCPHRPDEGCACRKPGPALLEQAAANLRLDLRRSFVVGDKLLDAATARAVRALGVLVRTGYGREEEGRLERAAPAETPDHVAEHLGEAAEWIIERRAAINPD